MAYFTRYFRNYFDVEAVSQPETPVYGGIFAGVAHKDKGKFKRWLERRLVKRVIVEAKGEAGVSVSVFAVGFGISPNPRITPFTVSEGVRRPLLSLKSPKKPKKAQPDKRLVAARKAEALRLAKRKVEEEVLLLALI